MESPKLRTLQDVQALLGYARLNSTELQTGAQCLHFTETLESTSTTLMEVDNCLLDKIEAGSRVTIKGDKEDCAVLCSSDETYEIRLAETSNVMLLLPNCSLPNEGTFLPEIAHCDVMAMKYDYLEAKKTKPRLKRIKSRLEENPYDNPREQPSLEGKYTFETLTADVQASHVEIQAYLKQLNATEIEGYIQMVSLDVQQVVLDNSMLLYQELGWTGYKLEVDAVAKMLEEDFYIPRNVSTFVLRCLSQNADENDPMITLNEDKVCQFCALVFLKQVAQGVVPEGMNTNLGQLRGIALVNRDSTPESIKYYSPQDLSDDVSTRFNELFSEKEKWTLDDISPYIEDLSTEKMSIGALLTKFARASTLNGTRVYSSRKPIL